MARVNPSAKLPCTFARSEKDYPYFDKNAEEITYGYYHGYRLLDKNNIEAAFPFGFGLSYTAFGYDHLSIAVEEQTINVAVDVSNIGNVAGDEVVQLYVGALESKVERFKKELKAFQRVSLQAGETKTIRFALPVEKLAYYDVETKTWQVEKTDYQVFLGAPGNGLLKGTFTVK